MIQWSDQNNPYYGIVESLCFLYQEALRENLTEMAEILNVAVEESKILLDEKVLSSSAALSEPVQDSLLQVHLLKSFQALTIDEKWLLVRQMEGINNAPNSDQDTEIEAVNS